MTSIQAFDALMAFYEVEVESRHRRFMLDENTRLRGLEISTILTKENPKFGLLLCGQCGNGKTTFINALQSLINWLRDMNYFENGEIAYVRKVDAKEVADLSRIDYQEFMKLCRLEKIVAIDDLGEEPAEVLDYGNIQNPILKLVEYRYDNQLPTFITSNLDPPEITAKYGERIGDRLFEMVEKVVFETKIENSYRRM